MERHRARSTAVGRAPTGGGLGRVAVAFGGAVLALTLLFGRTSFATEGLGTPGGASQATSTPGTAQVMAVPSLRGLQGVPTALGSSDARLLYDTNSAGWAAYRDSWSGPGPLRLVGPDGNVVAIDIGPVERLAPQAARFSPDGAFLAVVDGAGALWTINLATAELDLVASNGPSDLVFGRSLRFGDRDHVYVQLVGSVEIPIPSHPAILDLRDGSFVALSDDAWAYAPAPLADGSTAYLHLNANGSYVARRTDGSVVVDIAQVGFIHGGFDFNADGAVVFSDGSTTRIVLAAGGKPITLGAGTDPRFASDGQSVLVFDASHAESKLLGLDGSLLATFASPYVQVTGKGS